MTRWFDHQILLVRDVPAAIGRFERLGFHLSPHMRQSFGPSNALMMFRGNFLELLGDLDKADDNPGLELSPGYSRIAYFSADARRDRESLAAAGLLMTPVKEFSREVPMPDGRTCHTLCGVTFAVRADFPELAGFVTNQKLPEFIWIPEWQSHPNGVERIVAIVCLAEEPERHREYFSRLIEPVAIHGDDQGLMLVDESGVRLEILAPAACRRRFGDVVPRLAGNRTAGVVGLGLQTRSISMARRVLERAGVRLTCVSPRRFVVDPQESEGAILEFIGAD